MISTILKLLIVLAIVLSIGFYEHNQCPNIVPVTKNDIPKYLGTWYETARSKSMPFESGVCIEAQYSLLPDGNVKVDNSEVNNGVRTHAYGVAKVINGNPNRLNVNFGGFSALLADISALNGGNYEVYETDFDTYSIVWSCSDLVFEKIVYVWLLTRQPDYPQDLLQQRLQTIHDKLGVDLSSLQFTVQNEETCGKRSN